MFQFSGLDVPIFRSAPGAVRPLKRNCASGVLYCSSIPSNAVAGYNFMNIIHRVLSPGTIFLSILAFSVPKIAVFLGQFFLSFWRVFQAKGVQGTKPGTIWPDYRVHYQTTRRELSEVNRIKSVISESEIRNSKSEVHMPRASSAILCPSLSGISMTKDAHTSFGRENHRHAFGL